MADDSIKGFTIEWMGVGLLIFCLISFAFGFMYFNSDTALDSQGAVILNDSNNELRTKLFALEGDANEFLNITSQSNPEASLLGSRDSVATAYGYRESSLSTWNQLKILIGWVFTGEAGKALLAVLSGMLGFLSLYYIIKFFRTGT